MKKVFAVVSVIVTIAITGIPAMANSCTAKRLKVKQVCGIVVDGSGVPIQGATLQLVSPDGAPLTRQLATQSDGQFSIGDAPVGDLLLAISAPHHNSGKWPLKITQKFKQGQCKKPLSVHLAGCLGCACGDYVGQK